MGQSQSVKKNILKNCKNYGEWSVAIFYNAEGKIIVTDEDDEAFLTVDDHPIECSGCPHFNECLDLHYDVFWGKMYDPKHPKVKLKDCGRFAIAKRNREFFSA
jgi:hypothetical protein